MIILYSFLIIFEFILKLLIFLWICLRYFIVRMSSIIIELFIFLKSITATLSDSWCLFNWIWIVIIWLVGIESFWRQRGILSFTCYVDWLRNVWVFTRIWQDLILWRVINFKWLWLIICVLKILVLIFHF